MGRPRKNQETDLDSTSLLSPDPHAAIPVKVVPDERPNPYLGKYPMEGEPLPKKRYRFTYNQQPGTPMEFTRGITVLSKGTGRPKTEFHKFKIEDGEEVELPVEIAEFLMGLNYFEDGRSRPRCTLAPVV